MKLLASLPRIIRPFGFALILCLGAAVDAFAVPTLIDVSPRGLQIGGTTTLTFVGSDLASQPRVILPLAIAKQGARPGAQANQVQIDVTLDKSTPAGIYHVRLATHDGISNALAIGIDELPLRPLAAEVASLPIALHGSLAGGQIVETRFTGKAGQRVVIDLEARRLGAGFDPVLEIERPGGGLLNYSPAQAVLGGDARLDVALPADGAYNVRVYDSLYRAAGPGQFRLKIGQFNYADVLLPMGVERGKQATLEAIATNLPTGTKWTMQSDSPFGLEPAPWPAGSFSGGRPRVFVSNMPEVAEIAPAAAGAPQEVAAPVGISGRLSQPGEVDRYLVKVKPGMRLRFDVLAERLGSSIDAVLSIQHPGGAQLAAADDGENTTDPTLDFNVPGGMEKLLVAIQDQTRQGGPHSFYRLSITEAKPDFTLTALADRVNVPKGGLALLRVRAQRAGYNGPIKLSVPGGLPSGVSFAGDTIPAGASDALVTFRAEANASGAVIAHMVGHATSADAAGPHPVLAMDSPTARYQPWLQRELPIAVTRAAPLQVAWDEAATPLVQGITQPRNVKVTRGPGAAGPVRLSLVTSQLPPVITAEGPTKGQPDMAKTLRINAPIMVAANQDRGALPVIVPRTLPAIEYDVAVRAELLSSDGQRVLGESVSPPRRFAVAAPSFTLALTSPAKIDARAGKGPTGKFTGRIQRLGFPYPITLSLAGLPQGVASPSLVVPADKSEFEFTVALPKGAKPGELKGIKLIGASQLGPNKTVAAANQIDVQLNVVPGE